MNWYKMNVMGINIQRILWTSEYPSFSLNKYKNQKFWNSWGCFPNINQLLIQLPGRDNHHSEFYTYHFLVFCNNFITFESLNNILSTSEYLETLNKWNILYVYVLQLSFLWNITLLMCSCSPFSQLCSMPLYKYTTIHSSIYC